MGSSRCFSPGWPAAPEATWTDGNLYRRLENQQGGFGYEQLFFRFYMKFNREHAPIHHYGSGLLGFHPPTPWPQGGAGERPKGEARWTTQVEPDNFTSWNFYSYWQEMGGSPPRGQTWGNNFESGMPPRTVARERGICLEVMVKLKVSRDAAGADHELAQQELYRRGRVQGSPRRVCGLRQHRVRVAVHLPPV